MTLIFPIIIFMAFTLGALVVILYSARTYQHLVEGTDNEYEVSTSFAYITQKIRATDNQGKVVAGYFGELPALTIYEDLDGENGETKFVTYIYAYDGYLRELFTMEDSEWVTPESGTPLFPAEDFNAGFISRELLTIDITRNGTTQSQLVAVLSKETP